MTQYIDKAAIVAEIIKIYDRNRSNGYIDICDEMDYILSFLDTLEVKKVDLEKVFNDEYSKFSNDVDAMDYGFPIDLADYKDFAKHFFELGLKAQKGGEK